MREVLIISKQTNFTKLQTTIQDIPFIYLMGIVAVGLLATAMMLGYDFVLNRMLNTTYTTSYILKSSWIINSFNNLLGFGGLIGSGLRSEFFSHNDTEQKVVLKKISSILVFALSGLSILAMIALVLVLTTLHNGFVERYILWLIAGSLYFPIVYIMTTRASWMKEITAKDRIQLVSISLAEWFMVLVTFLVVGEILQQEVPLLEVSAVFVVCSIIGIASLVPGGLGSFDVLMIISLRAMGVDNETAVSWILLYRVAYYFIPFALGTSLFAGNLGTRLNNRFAGIPKQVIEFSTKKLLSGMLFLAGVVLILSNTVPINLYVKESSFSTEFVSTIIGIVVGFLLILFGRTSIMRLKKSFWPMCSVLVIGIVYCAVEDYSWFTVTYFIVLLLFAWLSRSRFTKNDFVYSWEARCFDGMIYGALVILYLLIGYLISPNIHFKNLPLKNFTWDFYLFPSERLWFYGLLVIAVTLGAVLLMMRYLKDSPQEPVFEEQRVRHVLETYGGTVTSHLAFVRDKQFFFYQEDGEDVLFMQYQRFADKCIVMGDPAGKQTAIKAGLQAMKHEMAKQNVKLVFYEVEQKTVMQLHELGFDFIKMGEEGHVYLPDFTMSGKKRKTLRAAMNKIEREGHTFEVLMPPFTATLIEELNTISNEWLNGRTEKGYSVGSFDVYYLNQAPIGIVRRNDGRIEAFVTLMPAQTNAIISIDLMRHRKDAVSGIMDYLFTSLFTYSQQQGYRYFNLGMAPFSEVGASSDSFIEERLAYFVYQYGNRFYSFKGLRSYKEKYANHWQSRYTVYPKHSSLIFVMIQLLVLINRDRS